MRASLVRLASLALALCVWSTPAQAQGGEPTPEPEVLDELEEEEEEEDTLGGFLELMRDFGQGKSADELLAFIEDARNQPDILNGALGVLDPKSGLGDFLVDTNLRFKTFESNDGEVQLGLEYDFDKSIMSPEATQEDESRFLYGVSFYGRGNIAFDQDVNPNDFLETGFRFNAFRHSFDSPLEQPITAEVQGQTQDYFTKIAAEDLEPEQYRATPEWQAITENVQGLLGRDVLLDFSGHGTLESNQDFSSSQFVLGLQAGLVAREWDPKAPLSRFNILDYPGALMRLLTGLEEQFTPAGTALPTISIGIDAVNPEENDARSAVGKDSTYMRFRSEVSMKSRVGVIADEMIWASLGWRYYREFDAPSAIEAADLDEHSYFAAKLDLPGGMFLSYSSGKLPLDVDSDSLLALGFQTSF